MPDRRDRHAPPVRRGARLFTAIGCADCHVAVLPATPSRPGCGGDGVRREVLWPYTDLLLHDMGEALADPCPAGPDACDDGGRVVAGAATRREWRTPPLWGIGLLEGHAGRGFLHDGRARTVLEAALWHGGEAEAARGRPLALAAADRAALVAFLRSL